MTDIHRSVADLWGGGELALVSLPPLGDELMPSLTVLLICDN